jgi:protein-S-isoprenylcysteine O-methyltransferase Ste14
MKLVERFVLAAVVSALPLGLAVLGCGLGHALAHPPLIVLALVLLALMIAGLFAPGGSLSQGMQEDRSNRWVLLAFFALGIIGGYVPAYTDRIDFWVVDGDASRWSGVALFAAGGALRLWPVYVLRNRFSGLVAIQPDHRLETSGIYGFIRHPSYLGLLLIMIGWALAFRSGVGLLITALSAVPLVARIRAEEALLRSYFGSEYEAYCAQTWRLVPGVY